MIVTEFSFDPKTRDEIFRLPAEPPAWALLYAIQGFPIRSLLRAFSARFPKVPVFGCTSFRGVFTPRGFIEGAALLSASANAGISAATALREANPASAYEAASSAAREIEQKLHAAPDAILMHATPGFEEAIIAGVTDVLGNGIPVYGGSAADDHIRGEWKVFADTSIIGQGFVLAGLSAAGARNVHGGFLDGYLPTHNVGTVTRSSGRTIFEIDGRPAANVYDDWSGGVISGERTSGGNVLLRTNLHPLGRVVDDTRGMPTRLLSHPHEVLPDGALRLFTEVTTGDRVELMIGTPEPLVQRVGRLVARAVPRRRTRLRSGLLVYCGGCLAAVLDRAPDISAEFSRAIAGAPFIGVATFGEQGSFGRQKANRHGNLMCSAVLFE